MIQHDIGRLPVLENGRVIGIITRSDTMRYFYDLLPE
jgi:tRNA nucleotidyltransferase (CCA-adding enzyme)